MIGLSALWEHWHGSLLLSHKYHYLQMSKIVNVPGGIVYLYRVQFNERLELG